MTTTPRPGRAGAATRHAAAGTRPLPGDASLDPDVVRAAGLAIVERALAEDLTAAGDVTSLATVAADVRGRADLVARADGVLSGGWLLAEVYARLDPDVAVELAGTDGDRVTAGDVLATVTGSLRSILTGERTALNLVTHLSGIATATRAFVDAVAGTGAVIRDTRKTVPGLRVLAKQAVRDGGGVNHRVGLSDALLVKDNHVVAAGGVAAATRAALAAAGDRHVQVEVDDMGELEEAVAAGARDVLLDNHTPDEVRRAVARVRELEDALGAGTRILLEASGTIRLPTVRAYAEAGVDRIAVGAITHSAPQLDLALDAHATTEP